MKYDIIDSKVASLFIYFQLDETQNNVSVGETEVGPTDSTSEFETARRIDAGVLSFKHFLMAMLILLISVAAYFLLQQDCPF